MTTSPLRHAAATLVALLLTLATAATADAVGAKATGHGAAVARCRIVLTKTAKKTVKKPFCARTMKQTKRSTTAKTRLRAARPSAVHAPAPAPVFAAPAAPAPLLRAPVVASAPAAAAPAVAATQPVSVPHAAALAAPTGPAGTTTTGTPPAPVPTTPAPSVAPSYANATSVFASSSVWNQPLAPDAPVDPASAPLVARMLQEVDREQAAHSGPYVNTTSYSVPVYRVPADQPTVTVTLENHVPDAALSAAWSAVPIPGDAKPAAGTDGHMVVYQPSTDRMWEFWKMNRKADGNWYAQWGGAMEHVSKNPGYFGTDAWAGAKTFWGATATSLPLLGGLMTIDELKSGHIDHALALAMPTLRKGLWALPAQRNDGKLATVDAMPEGAHLRIDPSVDLSKIAMPAVTRIIAEAAQKYGIIVRDYSGVIAFVGEDPVGYAGVNPYTNNPTTAKPLKGGIFGGQYPTAFLASFPWDKLQVMKMDLRSSKGVVSSLAL